MRWILTLVAALLLNTTATAKSDSLEVIKIDVSALFLKPGLTPIFVPDQLPKSKTVILYKMRENIIRRELLFVPKKKWMKWS